MTILQHLPDPIPVMLFLFSNDNVMMNSPENQLEVVRKYARKHGHQIAGKSCDDNISGMRFRRKGLNRVTRAVAAGTINAVVVKDLSRLEQENDDLLLERIRRDG